MFITIVGSAIGFSISCSLLLTVGLLISYKNRKKREKELSAMLISNAEAFKRGNR